ncbi:unnamed protein product [Tilletia laevis]|nr:unnamed protein product [Tilletia laevis]
MREEVRGQSALSSSLTSRSTSTRGPLSSQRCLHASESDLRICLFSLLLDDAMNWIWHCRVRALCEP